MPSTKTTINLNTGLRRRAKIEPFGSYSASYGVSRIIDRYTFLIAETKKELLEKFTSEELSFLKSILQNVKLSPASEAANILQERISGAVGLSEAEKENISKKISCLSKLETMALIESLEK